MCVCGGGGGGGGVLGGGRRRGRVSFLTMTSNRKTKIGKCLFDKLPKNLNLFFFFFFFFLGGGGGGEFFFDK